MVLSSWFVVGGMALDWLKSYLSESYQGINIGSVLSDAKRLLNGVLRALSWDQAYFH